MTAHGLPVLLNHLPSVLGIGQDEGCNNTGDKSHDEDGNCGSPPMHPHPPDTADVLRFVCIQCGMHCGKSRCLRCSHIKGINERDARAPEWRCEWCSIVYMSRASLIRHIKSGVCNKLQPSLVSAAHIRSRRKRRKNPLPSSFTLTPLLSVSPEKDGDSETTPANHTRLRTPTVHRRPGSKNNTVPLMFVLNF
jgi:hypothetical protein